MLENTRAIQNFFFFFSSFLSFCRFLPWRHHLFARSNNLLPISNLIALPHPCCLPFLDRTATDYTAAVYAYLVLSNATMPTGLIVSDQTGTAWIDFSALSAWYNATCTRSRDRYCYDSSFKFHSESDRRNAEGKKNKVVRYAYGFNYVLQNASTSTGVFATSAADGIAQVLANPANFAYIPATTIFPNGVIGGTFSNVTCS